MAPEESLGPMASPAPTGFFRKLLFGSPNAAPDPPPSPPLAQNEDLDDGEKKNGLIRRVSRKVVPGLPRMQTFKRQQSEKRDNLSPVHPTAAERRAMSVDRRGPLTPIMSRGLTDTLPRASAPDFLEDLDFESPSTPSLVSRPSVDAETEPAERAESNYDDGARCEDPWFNENNFLDDVGSITSSLIQDELETRWILNLSMHFRDKSNREKFFVTYREADTLWRRVTVSLDYRKAPENSLEMDLMDTKFQRDKSSKIYEAIRGSLGAISFYDTVTNLKLQTTDGRLHVHVAEDLNEIIMYPLVRDVQHLRCHRVQERDIAFDSHMSGFVYKVQVDGRMLIKKEIPGPDTINEFIYEINALHSLQSSSSVIDFFGVVVDDQDEHIKGLLISYADQGTLVDIIYDHQLGNDKGLHPLPWTTRATWARQVIQGLADIHEAGFVQGDFTLSNIVIDSVGDAKIIDINRRGCPVGWEPPELRPLIKSSQGISMYIGVKSDLYQLGMVLWALAMEKDEPEKYGPGLVLNTDAGVPRWYRRLVNICLSDDPRLRIPASSLLSLFPPGLQANDVAMRMEPEPPNREYGVRQLHPYSPGGCQMNEKPRIRTVSPSDRLPHVDFAAHLDTHPAAYESSQPYPTRGRSPPSPLTSNPGHYDMRGAYFSSSWTFSGKKASYSGAGVEDGREPITAGRTAQEENPVPQAHESEGNHSPKDSAQGAGFDVQQGDEQGILSQPPASEKDGACAELCKEMKTIVPRDWARVDNAADINVLSEKSKNADKGAALRPTENVGDLEKVGWNCTDALGIVSETGITEPNDPTASESRHAPSTGPVGFNMSRDREDPRGPTEPETARPNKDSVGAPDKSSTEYDRIDGSDKTQAIRDDDVGDALQLPPACDDGIGRISACEKHLSERASDGTISVLTGVGGIDEDGQGDLTQFPTSLEEEPGLMALSAKMATMMSAHRESGERISSPISVGY